MIIQNKIDKITSNTLTTPKESIILLFSIIAWLVICVKSKLGLEVPLLSSFLILYVFCKIRHIDYKGVQKAAFNSVHKALEAIVILISVGILIGTWIAGGTIPSIIYVGLTLINPQWFLLCTLILCSILSTATGTSYGSAGTAGVAMMAVGIAMGIPAGMIAGAVICGALFGDKISPFSDTTNLAPTMAGTDLFTHIRSMCYTTIPTYIIAAILFAVLGVHYGNANYDVATVQSYCDVIASHFYLSIWSIVPVGIVILLLLLKVDAIPAILAGAAAGVVCSMLLQGNDFFTTMTYALKGYSFDSGVKMVDKLLNRGGLLSMSSVVYIMIGGVALGGALEYLGVLKNILSPIVNKINSIPKLIGSTLLVSYITGAVGSTMAMAHVLTGKIMSPIYRKKGIAPQVCSRTMEDAGTLGGVLFPWHTNCIYFCGVLGVTYLDYLPYVFLSYLTPIMAMICAFTGFGIFYTRMAKEKIAIAEGECHEHAM